jgi:LysR family transcriptional regulator, cys regulon transcriptional activator
VPKGHALEGESDLTLRTLAAWPLITYADGVTGRGRIDEAFSKAGIEPDIAILALDADVIKSCVELGLGVGIVSELAFDPQRDVALARPATRGLFERNVSSIGLRRGRQPRGFVVRFIEMFAPGINGDVVRKALDRADV